MKVQSTISPPLIARLQGAMIVSYNVTEIEGGYEYDIVKVSEEPTRDEVIDALIRDKYTLSQEFALINNFNDEKDLEEYEAFQAFRAECKGIADLILNK
jgi:hypothetical protein